ncbi:MAG: 3-alpha,7-alpha,12-alpha-trihydroxy-5-beta-cholest-24-enoyl-CoA hydratase [Tepidiforma sp.]|uniref:3-alpha,7-alpha, 12-alpha-trihydroxy-5-beta-cholest-24-enoyl-CoA hydratase n=1 Tax=Tepidiforma bonchosmolovskayae TaxID=2601677 RepID=A0ABX6C628_9CHLR|nr:MULTISPECIES: MaoC/PaaZ C-terminal domain-containing protein [Tepidiforma]QFG03700.1 3-alpha,7-alpha,12-alpha-trihydroxy-5-beta-cholest-24-enoyl-CoA hydratase [Tepidiforma bonchosmolovskayae]GIW14959.1 MAG: 3-alpha,7-alpha,12-alpha-trihydroxy-5-beta-cholest-24-enoyl-CoA hydratase [Tepidiforma sp.]
MPIDPSKALGAPIQGGSFRWDRDRVILYHLGIGAGDPPTDPNELAYTYERNLKVLPSFGVIPAFGSLGGVGQVPGLQFNPALLLHGEQDLEIRKPIPVEGEVETNGKVAGIYDKGKAALVVLETETKLKGEAEPLFVNRFSLFLRGEGGFGGESGPPAGNEAPNRAPDGTVESKTLPQQALLYRLSGDKNPLHADPDFAKMGGFDRPILHGLCSFGVVCKAVVDHALGGDTGKVARYQARFAGVVFPGETIVTSFWREGNTILVAAQTKERGTPVITNAAITIRD